MGVFVLVTIITGNIIVTNLFLIYVLAGFEHLEDINQNNLSYLRESSKMLLKDYISNSHLEKMELEERKVMVRK